jgi:hypothetical protein
MKLGNVEQNDGFCDNDGYISIVTLYFSGELFMTVIIFTLPEYHDLLDKLRIDIDAFLRAQLKYSKEQFQQSMLLTGSIAIDPLY